jgi:hypothetical protein
MVFQYIALRILLPVAVVGTNIGRRGKEEKRFPADVRKPCFGRPANRFASPEGRQSLYTQEDGRG